MSPNGQERHAAWGLPAPRVQLPHWVSALLSSCASPQARRRQVSGVAARGRVGVVPFSLLFRRAENLILVSHLQGACTVPSRRACTGVTPPRVRVQERGGGGVSVATPRGQLLSDAISASKSAPRNSGRRNASGLEILVACEGL